MAWVEVEWAELEGKTISGLNEDYIHNTILMFSDTSDLVTFKAGSQNFRLSAGASSDMFNPGGYNCYLNLEREIL